MKGNEAAIQAVRNKALKDIIYTIKNPPSYCWQEETLHEAITSDIERTIRNLEQEILRIKEKYISRVSPEKEEKMDNKPLIFFSKKYEIRRIHINNTYPGVLYAELYEDGKLIIGATLEYITTRLHELVKKEREESI